LMKQEDTLDGCYSEIPRISRGDLELLPEREAEALAAFGKALSDPIRLQMIRLLEQRPDLCTCEFEEVLGLAQSKVSYHLKVLLRAGVVDRELHGTWSHYSLRDPELLEQLRALSPRASDRDEALTA
jgi:ArsR family transcriptional regulator